MSRNFPSPESVSGARNRFRVGEGLKINNNTLVPTISLDTGAIPMNPITDEQIQDAVSTVVINKGLVGTYTIAINNKKNGDEIDHNLNINIKEALTFKDVNGIVPGLGFLQMTPNKVKFIAPVAGNDNQDYYFTGTGEVLAQPN